MINTIVYFGETIYPFLKPAQRGQRLIIISEPSELVEYIKRNSAMVFLFDTAFRGFSRSLFLRVYRRRPECEFWLLSSNGQVLLPPYAVDAVLDLSVTTEVFGNRIHATEKVRELIDDYGMVGKSSNLKQVAETISQVAPTEISTLIIGPSGSGKELVARAIHNFSSRRNNTFMAVNCGALAEGILESELFGHEKGAFTGAAGRREGIFKRADGGTVFLDEVGETSPSLQVKLLRVLEEGTFQRVGGTESIHVDIRVVAATNRELTEAIADREFREDLYFRLGAIRINLHGLAERQADILPMINHFFIQQTGQVRGISESAMELLVNYGWPGNVRQLRNFVARMAVVSGDGEISEHMVRQYIEEQGFTDRNLPVVTGQTPQQAEFQLIYQALLSLGQEVRMLRDLIIDNLPTHEETEPGHAEGMVFAGRTLDDIEEETIRKMLQTVGGNRREAARRLGIGERTLYRKLKKYNLQ